MGLGPAQPMVILWSYLQCEGEERLHGTASYEARLSKQIIEPRYMKQRGSEIQGN